MTKDLMSTRAQPWAKSGSEPFYWIHGYGTAELLYRLIERHSNEPTPANESRTRRERETASTDRGFCTGYSCRCISYCPKTVTVKAPRPGAKELHLRF
ncbi:hypothetical protein EVAR_45756_1 [Eumeta japonica]|uniref:Uncharacterized protein n=1 Tax=Eumeta variegata TaxID=151549 RepID=A0A4C1YMI0_EUMVA|nr:hypothetical protein EVAR_45756_1 [Eumeta japonica]